jgi:hypothetical protein
MHDTAAHLVDRVIPHVPIRQWVVTFPRRVRHHLAADPKLATRALREITRTLFSFQRRKVRRKGPRIARARSNGAITFVQRFNSALELSLHFHMLVPDGVFVAGGAGVDERPRFVELEAPSNEEVAERLGEVARRVTKMLPDAGRLRDDDCGEEAEPPVPEAHRPLPARLRAPPAQAVAQVDSLICLRYTIARPLGARYDQKMWNRMS